MVLVQGTSSTNREVAHRVGAVVGGRAWAIPHMGGGSRAWARASPPPGGSSHCPPSPAAKRHGAAAQGGCQRWLWKGWAMVAWPGAQDTAVSEGGTGNRTCRQPRCICTSSTVVWVGVCLVTVVGLGRSEWWGGHHPPVHPKGGGNTCELCWPDKWGSGAAYSAEASSSAENGLQLLPLSPTLIPYAPPGEKILATLLFQRIHYCGLKNSNFTATCISDNRTHFVKPFSSCHSYNVTLL